MITIGDESCIVVVGDQGVQLWSLNGQTMQCSHSLEDTGKAGQIRIVQL